MMDEEEIKKLIIAHYFDVQEGKKRAWSSYTYEDGLRDAVDMIEGDWEEEDIIETLVTRREP